MVLLMREVPAGDASGNVIEVKYLSTGKTVTIQNGAANGPCFSPDGRKIAFFNRTLRDGKSKRHRLYTVNIDGSDRRRLHDEYLYTIHNGAQWSTDGYIYWTGWGCVSGGDGGLIAKAPKDGGSPVLAHDIIGGVSTPTGTTVDGGTGSFQMSLDGLRTTVTAQHREPDGSKAGWAQLCTRMDTHEEFSPWRPCQGGISPDGQILSVSFAGHRAYRFTRWPNPYVEYGTDGEWGNTYDGCPGHYDNMCPDYDTVIHLGADLKEMFQLEGGMGPEISSPRFSNSDNDIFIFGTSEKLRDERAGGAWLFELSTGEYTKVAPLDTDILDYYRTEITLSTPVVLAPQFTLFYVDTNGTLPGAKTVTLSSTTDMSGEPAVSGIPDWLNVDITRVSAREYTLACTVVGTAIPDSGWFEDSISVTPNGSNESLQMLVTLYVEVHPDLPITIANPLAGQMCRVGDTLRVEYSADSILIPGTLISLSVDAGDSWIQMHDDASWETGSNKVLEYVIPSTIDGRSLVSDQCLVLISRYPDGNETYSGVFSITESTGTYQNKRRESASARCALRVALKRSASAAVLTVTSPTSGTARLIDLQGRTAHAFRLVEGAQGIRLPSLKAGRYLLEISYASGARKTVVVDAF